MGDKVVTDFFKNNTTPWIAYKVLAAGAIKPEDGIRYAFSSGADFACIGMFDFQVIENANIAYDILNSGLERERKWYA
jgi:NAD(P)H-dependent flavin oxidoreductase YrpB (nitropropane dioxygenase family)